MPEFYGGCDVGSTTGKAVILLDDKVVGSSLIPSKIDPEETAMEAMETALKQVS